MQIRLLGSLLSSVTPIVTVVYKGEHRKMRVEAVGVANKTNIPFIRGWDFNRGAYRTYSESHINHIENVELINK